MAKNGRCPAGQYYCYTNKECKPIPKGFMVDPEGMLRKENGATIDEEGLRDWFGKSKSKDGKKGWVQVVSGKPCARQPGQKTTPKCVSSAKRASMSKSEREKLVRAKRASGAQGKYKRSSKTNVKGARKKGATLRDWFQKEDWRQVNDPSKKCGEK